MDALCQQSKDSKAFVPAPLPPKYDLAKVAIPLAEAGLEADSDESTQEVVNYLRALNTSLLNLSKLPLSHRVIKQAHEILLSGAGRLAMLRGDCASSGFRTM